MDGRDSGLRTVRPVRKETPETRLMDDDSSAGQHVHSVRLAGDTPPAPLHRSGEFIRLLRSSWNATPLRWARTGGPTEDVCFFVFFVLFISS